MCISNRQAGSRGGLKIYRKRHSLKLALQSASLISLQFGILRSFLGRLPLFREPPDEREEHRDEEADGDDHGLGHEHAGGLVARQRVVDVGHGGTPLVRPTSRTAEEGERKKYLPR